MQKIQEGLPESSGSSKTIPVSTYPRGNLSVLASANTESMFPGTFTVGSIPQVNPSLDSSYLGHRLVCDAAFPDLSNSSFSLQVWFRNQRTRYSQEHPQDHLGCQGIEEKSDVSASEPMFMAPSMPLLLFIEYFLLLGFINRIYSN